MRLPRKLKNHLSPYRRHAGSCKATNDLSCDCPIWAQGRIDGKYIRESLGTRSSAAAEAKIRELLRPPDPGGPGGHLVSISGGASAITLEQAEAMFLDAKKDKATATVTLYKFTVHQFRLFAEAHGITELRAVTPHLVQQYFSECGRNWAQRSKISRLTHLRVFFNYAKDMDWISASPAAKRSLTFHKPEGHAREPFSRQDVGRILRAIDLVDEPDRDRARALTLALLYSGMRISDATFLERSAISDDRILDYFVIKTGKRISLPIELHVEAVQALEKLPGTGSFFFQPERDYQDALLARRHGGDFSANLPVGFYAAAIRRATALVLQVLELAGVAGACHRFRDTFAVNMLVEGVDIFTVSQALGHSDVRITQSHYLNLVPGYRERMSRSTRVLDYRLLATG